MSLVAKRKAEALFSAEEFQLTSLPKGSKQDETLCQDDAEPSRIEQGRSRVEDRFHRRDPMPFGTKSVGRGEAVQKDTGSNIGRRGNGMPTLGGQPLGETLLTAEKGDHRGERIEDYAGERRWTLPRDKDHGSGEFGAKGYARDDGSNFTVRGHGNAVMFTAGFQSQVSDALDGCEKSKRGRRGEGGRRK